MARPKPDPDKVYPKIIASALRLIRRHGFDRLTMKSLAAESGMSVGKLYHFFSNKDELFLRLEIEYFEGLYQCFADAERSRAPGASAKDHLRTILSVYFDFAVTHFDLYQLVTSPPKVFSNYLGTRDEALAKEELESALRVIAGFREVYLAALADAGAADSAIDSRFLMLVNSVHGLILMGRSKAWPYITMAQNDARTKTETRIAEQEEIEIQLDLIVSAAMARPADSA